jgi:hypothetical protein
MSAPDASPPPPPPPPAAEPTKKPWWKRWWGITAIVVVVIAVLGSLGDDTTTEDPDQTAATGTPTEEPAEDTETDESTEDAATETAEETEPAETEEAEEEPTEEEPPGPEPVFANGTHVVGEDIEPGIYRSDGTSMCYWARLSGFSGDLDDIITNGNNPLAIVEVKADDAGFESTGCGDWYALEDTYPEVPATEFTDGVFEVGTHIEPGRYRADGSEMCYWARLSGFGATLDDIITNGNNPTTIEISESDAGFEATGCGTWTKS